MMLDLTMVRLFSVFDTREQKMYSSTKTPRLNSRITIEIDAGSYFGYALALTSTSSSIISDGQSYFDKI